MRKALFFGNNLCMNKKEYISALSRLITNRVKFHAPRANCENLDLQLLQVLGINSALPIFKFDKPMTSILHKAFVKAQKETDFVLISQEKYIKRMWRKSLKNLYFLDEDCSPALNEIVNCLNINYLSHSSFKQNLNKKYIKINQNEINLDYKQFFLYKKAESNGVVYEIKNFLLNGNNFVLNFVNPHLEKRQIMFEINIPLPNGYYQFTKVKTGIKIYNLSSKKSAYFNFDYKDCHLKFSCIDGIENSTHACINLSININLFAKEQRKIYFNFGENAYIFKNFAQIDKFFEISQQKAFQMFDVKISSKDKTFDDMFNNVLPQKIWLAWINDGVDESSESKYLNLKNEIVKYTQKGFVINEHFKGLKEVKIFCNNLYKRVFIISGQQRFILAQKTRYVNFTQVCKDFFDKSNEIYLCFGR